MRTNAKLTRALHLEVLPNAGKLEDLRYSASRYKMFVQHWVTQLYFNPAVKHLSTRGMGQLSNQAQHRASGILNAHRASVKETGSKSNCPSVRFTSCPATIESSHSTQFDYWVSFETQFSKRRVRVPARSHKRLNKFLREGWSLTQGCEIVFQKSGRLQVRVFVEKQAPEIRPSQRCLGVDVGIHHAVSRSDGYLGVSLGKIMRKSRARDVARRQQGHSTRVRTTSVKQQLDVEVRRALARCQSDGLSLAVESPKVLANLRSGKLHGWARSYFAHRATTLASESGIRITYVNPAYSSRTCSVCGNSDARSRVKQTYRCVSCGSRTHADLNAARVIAQRGTECIRLRERNSPLSTTLSAG